MRKIFPFRTNFDSEYEMGELTRIVGVFKNTQTVNAIIMLASSTSTFMMKSFVSRKRNRIDSDDEDEPGQDLVGMDLDSQGNLLCNHL